jgi:hypothetical protein
VVIPTIFCGFCVCVSYDKLVHNYRNSSIRTFDWLFELSCAKIIAGHRHRGRCRRYRHSGIHHLSLVLEHSGTGLGLRITVLDWFRHRHFFSFWYRSDQKLQRRSEGCSTYQKGASLLRRVQRSVEGTYCIVGSVGWGIAK